MHYWDLLEAKILDSPIFLRKKTKPHLPRKRNQTNSPNRLEQNKWKIPGSTSIVKNPWVRPYSSGTIWSTLKTNTLQYSQHWQENNKKYLIYLYFLCALLWFDPLCGAWILQKHFALIEGNYINTKGLISLAFLH